MVLTTNFSTVLAPATMEIAIRNCKSKVSEAKTARDDSVLLRIYKVYDLPECYKILDLLPPRLWNRRGRSARVV